MDKDLRKDLIDRLEQGYIYGKEALNILLSNAFSGEDTAKTVDALLTVFPSANAVIDADFGALMAVPGMTRRIAEYIVVLGKAREALTEPLKVVENSERLIGYGIAKYRGRDCEMAELYCVNKNGKVVLFRRYGSEQLRKVELDFRTVISEIASSGACGFYLLHNHVYGEVRPSAADDLFTAKLISACPEGGAPLIDHCIVGEREGFSYLKSGRLKQLKDNLANNLK